MSRHGRSTCDAAARAELLERLERIHPDSQRRWGRMTPHQMICHVSDAFRAGLGEREVAPAGNWFTRTVIKWGALHLPVPWPKGYPTRPEVDPNRGGTQPGDFAADRGELERLVERFARPARGRHGIFGPMSTGDWGRWGYLHMDHHLRQFGV